MKVKGKNETGPLKDDGFVVLVSARHIPGVGGQPAVLFLQAEIKNFSSSTSKLFGVGAYQPQSCLLESQTTF